MLERQLPKLHIEGSISVATPLALLHRNMCACVSWAPVGMDHNNADLTS